MQVGALPEAVVRRIVTASNLTREEGAVITIELPELRRGAERHLA